MKSLKILTFVFALMSLIPVSGSFAASEDAVELNELQVSFSKMQEDLGKLKAQYQHERNQLRESAGGMPEALRSKGKNATVRISGELAVRYYADFKYYYEKPGTNAPSGGEYADKIGWDFDTPSLKFDISLNEDLGAFIDIRPNSFDKAYFYWNNIAGTRFGAEIGYIGIPGGMYSSSFSPWGNIFITNPGVKNFGYIYSVEDQDAANNPGDDITRMGVQFSYHNDQYIITGTVFSPGDLGEPNDLLDGYNANNAGSILSANGDVRNNGVMNHSLMFEYMPAFIEGLNFAATYIGMVDIGQGASTAAGRRGTVYNPQFDLGVAYLKERYNLYIEADYNFGRNFYADTSTWCISAGGDYALTEKFKVAAGGDVGMLNTSNELYKTVITNTGNKSHIENTSIRARIAAAYFFDCGMWYKLEYGHVFFNTGGVGDAGTKSRDSVVFEAGVGF